MVELHLYNLSYIRCANWAGARTGTEADGDGFARAGDEERKIETHTSVVVPATSEAGWFLPLVLARKVSSIHANDADGDG